MSRSAHGVRAASLRPVFGRRDGAANPLRLERRVEPREAGSGRLAAAYRGEGRYGITQLELVDRSASGLGAITATRIDPGMTVTICPEGSTIPWLSARAVRCTPDHGTGMFRVGLVFERRIAA